jgi:WD40 repeat protein
MKGLITWMVLIFLLCCVGCDSVTPAPSETIASATNFTNTTVFKEKTPTMTVAAPTGTTTKRATTTITSPKPPTATPVPDQNTFDFSKYGPFVFIEITAEKMSLQMINPDGSMVDWKFEPEKDYFFDEVAWSHDGTRLVLSTTWDGINLLSIENKEVINLSATNEFSIIFSPAFSPDGKFITFFAYNEGAIFRINSDGTGLMNLTPNANYRNSYDSPSWSPSGEQIVYARAYTDGMIYSMNADGTASRKLIEIGWNDHPQYSPDGRWLGFIRYDDSQGYLYAMPVGGGPFHLLSGNDNDVLSYSWSPDGRYLVYEDFLCQGPCVTKYWIVEFETGLTWELKIPVQVFKSLKWSPIMEISETREDCTSGWTQLEIGKFVQLIGEVPNRVRTNPQPGANVVGQFLPDETYILLDGPVCADGLVWWEIADPSLPGGAGWTAEGDGQVYWLEPID